MSIPKYFLENVAKLYLMLYAATTNSWMGVYTLITHFGGLFTVFIFSPIEIVCFNLFSRQFSDYYLMNQKPKSKDSNSSSDYIEEYPLMNILDQFATILKYLFIFNGLLLAYGIPYSEPLLTILLGNKWNIPDLIASFQIYIILMVLISINGISESFLIASMKSEDIRYYNYTVWLNKLVFILGLFFFSDKDCMGVFLAEIVSKTLRIIVSFSY